MHSMGFRAESSEAMMRRILDSEIGRKCAADPDFRSWYMGLTKQERKDYRADVLAPRTP